MKNNEIWMLKSLERIVIFSPSYPVVFIVVSVTSSPDDGMADSSFIVLSQARIVIDTAYLECFSFSPDLILMIEK